MSRLKLKPEVIASLAVMFATMFVQTSNASNMCSTEATRIRFSNIQLNTGVRLHYAEQGERGGPVVLMLHGFTDSWFSYSRVLKSMDPKYHVYVLDQRGHGDSDQPRNGYTPRVLADDVLAFMNAIGINEATVVGHSMGSFVAQHIATLEPERVKKLVLIGSAPSVKNTAVYGLQRDINALSDSVPEKFVRDFQVGLLVQPVPDDFINSIIAESRRLPARIWKEVIKDLLTGADAELAKIKSPTLIVWGREDGLVPLSEGERFHKDIAGSTMIVFDQCAHVPNIEKAGEFNAAVIKFLGAQ